MQKLKVGDTVQVTAGAERTQKSNRGKILAFDKVKNRVRVEGLCSTELIHLHGVIYDQVGGDQRIGEFRIGAQFFQRIAHGSQIDHARYAGEILQQHARRHKGDFLRFLG